MKLTPAEIANQQFKSGFRGYDKDEIRAFLDVLSKEIEDLQRENSFLKDEIERLNKEMERYRGFETSIKDAVVAAQRMSENFREQAKKEGDTIIAAAKNQAERTLIDAEKKSALLNAEIARLNGRISEIKEMARGIVKSFIDNLEEAEKK